MSQLRDILCKGASLALGCALAYSLAQALAPDVALVLPQAPKPLSVPVRLAVAAPKPVTPEPAQDAQRILPLKTDKAVDAPKREVGQARKRPERQPMPAPIVEQETPPTAPATAVPVAAVDPELPIDDEAPEAPPEFDIGAPTLTDYPETPGGNVLVLGLLINDRGVVIDSRILVPSYDTLTDLAVSMASIGQTWTSVQPPLRYGETRWLELRVPFKPQDRRLELLP